MFELLRGEDAEIRADKLIDPSAIAGEAVLVAWHGSPGGFAYVTDLATIAQVMLRGRGEQSTIEPAVFGKLLKLLGFATERDARGKKLHLTEAVRERAQQIVRDFGGRGRRRPASNPVSGGSRALTIGLPVYAVWAMRAISHLQRIRRRKPEMQPRGDAPDGAQT